MLASVWSVALLMYSAGTCAGAELHERDRFDIDVLDVLNPFNADEDVDVLSDVAHHCIDLVGVLSCAAWVVLETITLGICSYKSLSSTTRSSSRFDPPICHDPIRIAGFPWNGSWIGTLAFPGACESPGRFRCVLEQPSVPQTSYRRADSPL